MPFLEIKRRVSRILGYEGERETGGVRSELEYALRSRRDIDPRVRDAVLNVPREEFVSPQDRNRAREDRALSIGLGQTISQPSLVAHVVSELRIPRTTATVLDVGCGSGYQAAILSMLANQVITVERIAELADAARSRLTRLGYRNVEVVLASEDTLGHPAGAPYDAIIVGASVPDVPLSLVRQLKLDGRLVIPVGPRRRQRIATVTRNRVDFDVQYGVECVFVPLIGPEAW